MSELERFRAECSRLFDPPTINDSYDVLDIYSEFLFLAMRNHHLEEVFSYADADAKIVLQMMLTKTLHLKSLVGGIDYNSPKGYRLNRIIDPTVVASLVRNIYETTGMFNLIFRNTKSKEEKQIIYQLWVHAGLKYRQKFESVIISQEQRDKFEREKQQLAEIAKSIESSRLYSKLNSKNQKKIRDKLKDKDYLIRFNRTEVEFLHWHNLAQIMGIKKGYLDNIYTYFSLYAHPSNVSVFQFENMFTPGSESCWELANFNLKNAFFLLSIFVADYIYLFPNALTTFNNLDLRDQIVINYHNTFMRGYEGYSINNSWEALG